MRNLDWMTRAACAGMDTELWYARTLAEMREAESICNTCPVKDLCAQYAEGEEWGIWAGEDKEVERVKAATARRQAERDRKTELRRKDMANKQQRYAERVDAHQSYLDGNRDPETVRLYKAHAAYLARKRAKAVERRNEERRNLERYRAGARDNDAIAAFERWRKKRGQDNAAWHRMQASKETA